MRLRDVSRDYDAGGRRFAALRGVHLDVRRGESVAVVGRSGSGKSTLLNLLTGIDRPTTGTIDVGGAALHAMSEGALTAWRGRHVGIVFQQFHLLPTLSVADNVLLAMDFVGVIPARERRTRALHLLDRVGLADHAAKPPGALSGGEQQRAAVARALANDPSLLVADEPTGNLDSRTSDAIVALLLEQVAGGRTLLVVTHDAAIASRLGRTVTLDDGRVARDTVPNVLHAS
ncbi:ABC transporter related protein [Gemmatirosa kalamazoonensis]|uniref:ABC transporter related protein n=1 Tax=Gemmatirosa kalamazoonensis TaxID=861299 RepID=W0RF00_9BACT|nr:ABC transporter related protein [Gemmatirosa kalamazoonensis]